MAQTFFIELTLGDNGSAFVIPWEGDFDSVPKIKVNILFATNVVKLNFTELSPKFSQ